MTKERFSSKVYILASGGIDSTALIHFYLSNGFQVCLIFIDYNQQSIKQEKRAVKRIAKYYSTDLQVIIIKGVNIDKSKSGFIMGRNGMFLSLTLTIVKHSKGIISLGIHSGTNYNDCTPTFVQLAQSMMDLYTDGQVQVEAPFLNWSKQDIFEYCEKVNVPLSITYSCENGLLQPCGKCMSCKDLEQYRKYVSKNKYN